MKTEHTATICPKCGHGTYLIKGELKHECPSYSKGPYYVGEYAHPDGRSSGLERGIFTSHGQIKLAVCEQWEGEKESQEAEANAHLFSAAWELVESLKAVLRDFVPSRDKFTSEAQRTTYEQARAAISKAKGGV